jgi:hypothetical protein
MRVLILGIDALEYTLVETWDLKHLKQHEYGKTIVPIYKGGGEPVTLVVWPCFITGKEPDEMGYNSPILYRQPLKFILDALFYPFYSMLHSSPNQQDHESITYKTTRTERLISRFNYYAMKAGLGRYPTRNDIKASTLFDNPAYKSLHLHVPVYDESHTLEDHCNPRNNVIAALTNKNLRKQFDERLMAEFNQKTQEVYDILHDDSWQLCMQYFYVLDGIQHVFFKNKLKIMNYYMHFNEFVRKITETLPKDILLLIIADHGHANGLHTTYGYYSCNTPLHLHNPHISDFKTILEKKVLENK